MSNVNTNVKAGNTRVNMGVNNASTNTNNISNVAQRRPGVQTMPVAIPIGRNSPPPPPQMFVPMAIAPGPITYPMSGDVQSILNQPAAVQLDGPPDLTQYIPPVYAASGPPTMPPPGASPYDFASKPPMSPQDAAALIAALSQAPAPEKLPMWKDPNYVVPSLLALLAVAAGIYWWKSGKTPARANDARTVLPANAPTGNIRFQAPPRNFTVPRRVA